MQRIIDGLANGAIYAWMALAFSLVYKCSGRLNLAQGEISNVGTYLALVFATGATPTLAGTGLSGKLIPFHPLPVWAAIVLAMAGAGLMAMGIERFIIRRSGDNAPVVSVGLTIGVLLVLNSGVIYIWKPVNRGFRSPFPTDSSDYLRIGQARLRYEYIGTLIVLLLVVGLIHLVLTRTKFGLGFRAVSSDAAMSRLMGIRSGRMLSVGWASAAATGTPASSLVANRVILEPNMMVRLLVFGFAAATIGGLDSLAGAVAGGLGVGVLETLISGYVHLVGSDLTVPVMLFLMVATLLVRPTGLLGTPRVTRV
jgi:branched-chain amino acid transport system permease protein